MVCKTPSASVLEFCAVLCIFSCLNSRSSFFLTRNPFRSVTTVPRTFIGSDTGAVLSISGGFVRIFLFSLLLTSGFVVFGVVFIGFGVVILGLGNGSGVVVFGNVVLFVVM